MREENAILGFWYYHKIILQAKEKMYHIVCLFHLKYEAEVKNNKWPTYVLSLVNLGDHKTIDEKRLVLE